MIPQDTTLILHGELIACGLDISGCDSSGAIYFLSPDEKNIAPLVLAAHDQPLESDEAKALQAAISEEQWSAYKNARNALVKAFRQAQYSQNCDPIILTALEDSLVTATTTTGKITVKLPENDVKTWLAAKENVRNLMPCPE
ncbi:MAG: hypothetical protein ACP5VS_01495 [Desulfomonilaceae bacterium]